MASPALMTVEEFVKMETADTEAFELVDGVLVPFASPLPIHGVIKDRLIRLVGIYFDRNPIGGAISETDSHTGRFTVRRPDYSIFIGDRWKRLDLRKIPIPFAPDIAIEVLSPSEHAQALNRKIRDYLSAGSQEVWIIDPENCQVDIRTPTSVRSLQGTQALESALLPGFSVTVDELLTL